MCMHGWHVCMSNGDMGSVVDRSLDLMSQVDS